jgi:hypothetical protein
VTHAKIPFQRVGQAKPVPQCPVTLSQRSRGRSETDHAQDAVMKKDRRWMKSVIATSNEVQVALPWARSTRRRPEAMKSVAAQKPRAMAAR